ncbi:MAG: TIGR00701 family protein [Porticoccaceae bacterium]|nr:TIGR00701 family protein [Porticoccaceae bacterium]
MYDWAKAFHIISMTTWFAALFYLPRLFVYHATARDKISIERFKIMQSRLYHGIANPSMLATMLFGLWLFSMSPTYYLNQVWFDIKLLVVALAVIYHFFCLRYMLILKADANLKSHLYFRIFNEIPVVFLVSIVVLVVVRPFQ